MRHRLLPHPSTVSTAVEGIEVDVSYPSSDQVLLRYSLMGDNSTVRFPSDVPCERKDELWQQTCFELFVAVEGAAYYEFNFSPSTQWAAYKFDAYRSGMVNAAITKIPVIKSNRTQTSAKLSVLLDLSELTDLSDPAKWRVGLSAVIEEMGGDRSYWALTHPSGAPDFHHIDCFALRMSAQGGL